MTRGQLISADERAEVMAHLSDMFLGGMFDNGKVKDHLCQSLISRSAYWFKPQGPAKAPKHGERVISGKIDFGANSLAVSRAVHAMIYTVRDTLNSNYKIEAKQLLGWFESCLTGSVQKYNGVFCTDYPAKDGYMHFGNQAIHTGEFAREFFDLAKCHLITF